MHRHSNESPECPSCNQKLTLAHPLINAYFKLIRTQFPDAHVSEVFRDKDAQNEAVKEGRSRLLWPDSAHNHMQGSTPKSRAMDIFQLEGTRAKWDPKYFVEIVRWCKSEKLLLRYGLDFDSLHDSCHFELIKDIP